ncbi:MAG TPA: hypothetical protein VJ734_03290 [Nitrosospira sp.]|nr:hypothetical protein [Nitrosospira sp.]
MNGTLRTKLEAIDAGCESEAQTELNKLYESVQHHGGKFSAPSPQAAEAIWLRLIARKEQEFIQEMIYISKPKQSDQAANAIPVAESEKQPIEDVINAAFSDNRYVERMQEFFQEVARKAERHGASFDMDAKRLSLIDATYRSGVADALRRARRNVFDEFKLKQRDTGEDPEFLSQWRQYSTLSPWRSIWTIALLMLTSYLIAFIVRSDAFRGLIEGFGWPAGAGM